MNYIYKVLIKLGFGKGVIEKMAILILAPLSGYISTIEMQDAIQGIVIVALAFVQYIVGKVDKQPKVVVEENAKK